MKYIRPEIEINEIQTEDVITLSFGNILNWGDLSSEQQSKVEISTKGGTPSIDIDADFFG